LYAQIVRLQQVIGYITHLERNIEAIYSQMNTNCDFRDIFMTTNRAWPPAMFFAG